ncbi:UvrD-helicase-domain-containing protein [Agrocybe pediades]|nr:UvrD-helicase-domain-containing protein [Agrocybe pediades]
MTTDTMGSIHVLGLNPAQLKAVEHDPSTPLQILAGPGSGKTKVLTSRITRLILTHNLSPSSICAVTFTNKAANEMRDRLNKLLGKSRTVALQMGTFHSLCAKFLRKHPSAVNLDPNFTICDADDSKKLLSALMKPYADYMVTHDIVLTHGSAASIISQAKAKGKSAAVYFEEIEEKESSERKIGPKSDCAKPKSMLRILAEVYIGYEKILKDNNALDFDDLLIYGVKLFSSHKESVLWCAHILVDEFQDTNTMQYELMKAIGFRRCITIVGDPDQSIYGWRSAEVANLSRMRKDFPNTQQIFLEQNYRSTAAILRACLGIVSEDKNRIPKSLHTMHPLGATPVISQFAEQKEETTFMAQEIKRCVANMGGVLRWSDFVILLRYNALSRPIESALQLAGIPCKILGGHKFFERMEVKDLLAYLQIVDNPNFNPAFVRAVRVPPRGMGDKSLAELETQALKHQIPQLELLERICNGKVPDIKPPIKKKVSAFMQVICKLRTLSKENCPPSVLITRLVDLINYEEYLKKTQQDWDSRWENVQELITFATEVEKEAALKGSPEDHGDTKQSSVLRDFLQASCLSSEGDNDSNESNDQKVTISTCHAAKGLEWPIVMVPSVDSDTFPFYRTTDVDEERRLLYVACTRAQSLLYLMFAKSRTVGGKTQTKQLSKFVSAVYNKNPGYFTMEVPRFTPNDRVVISNVLSRPIPDQVEVDRRLGEFFWYMFYRRIFQIIKELIRRLLVDLNHLYAAPDALAAISANFQKDYKKAPFSNAATYSGGSFSRPNTFSDLSANQPFSISRSSIDRPSHSSEPTSQQQPDEHLPSFQIHPKNLSVGFYSAASAFASGSTSEHPLTTTATTLASGSRSLRLTPVAQGKDRKPSNNKVDFVVVEVDSDGGDENTQYEPPVVAGLQPSTSINQVSTSKAPCPRSNHDRTRSPGKTTKSTLFQSFKTNIPHADYSGTSQMHPVMGHLASSKLSTAASRSKKIASTPMITSSAQKSYSVPGVAHPAAAPVLVAAAAAGCPEHHRSSQNANNGALVSTKDDNSSTPMSEAHSGINTPTLPQAAVGGLPVKRRLGMGRATTGYSNKKFKRPV